MFGGNCVMAAVVVTEHWQWQEYYYQYAFEAYHEWICWEKVLIPMCDLYLPMDLWKI
jgi:hypothetical protein